jgi:alpha-D-ribose 1-methylphosphonate 5-triphosphate synthase subunit PhnG
MNSAIDEALELLRTGEFQKIGSGALVIAKKAAAELAALMDMHKGLSNRNDELRAELDKARKVIEPMKREWELIQASRMIPDNNFTPDEYKAAATWLEEYKETL